MCNKRKVKGYQKGFLKAVGLSLDELLKSSKEEIWAMIFSFCSLNDSLIIKEEEERYILMSFCNVKKEEQSKIVDDFLKITLRIRKDVSGGKTF